jgi:hypothetical protein
VALATSAAAKTLLPQPTNIAAMTKVPMASDAYLLDDRRVRHAGWLRPIRVVKLFCTLSDNFIYCQTFLCVDNNRLASRRPYSTVTDFARFLGLSTSVPRASAV